MPLQRKLYINQYGSNLDPLIMEQGASSDFIEIEVSNSRSDLAYETSNSASRAHSNSSDSDASISNVPSLDVNQLFNDITDQMSHIMESQATTLPPQWPLHEFSRVVIGEKRLYTTPVI